MSNEHPPADDWSQTRPIPTDPAPAHHVEHTVALPPGPPAQPPAGERTGRRRTAGLLAGALLLGGAGGLGGAAAYDAATDGDAISATSSSSGSNVSVSNTAEIADGTVEKVSDIVLPSVVRINVAGAQRGGSGSGVVLSEDGDILTNNHVVATSGAQGRITVNFHDGTTKTAKIVGQDPVTDIAVIRADDVSGLTPAKIGKSSDLDVGQAVLAVGSPFGLDATVTTGIVSALNRPVSVARAEAEQEQEAPDSQLPDGFPFDLEKQQEQPQAPSRSLSTTYPAIQTDAAINPGNSGGALVDMAGRVIGINSSIRTSGDGGLSESGGSIGLGFAIPIDPVLPIVNQILDDEKPTHARLGVNVADVSGDDLVQGAEVSNIESGSAGAKAGLRDGDVITKVDDQIIDGSESLVATIRGQRPGEKVTLTVRRGGDTRTVEATLGSDEDSQDS